VRHGLLGGVASGDALAGLLPAVQAEGRCRSEPIWQDREGLSTRPTNAAPHPNALALVIVALTESPSMADDRVVLADWTSPREKVQRDHPGSALSSASSGAIKRITAGVKAATDRPCQVSI